MLDRRLQFGKAITVSPNVCVEDDQSMGVSYCVLYNSNNEHTITTTSNAIMTKEVLPNINPCGRYKDPLSPLD